MCEPISITIGVLSAVGAGAAAIGQHQQQQAAVSRSNAIAQQQYAQQLQIAKAQDIENGRAYEASLKASAAAKNSYYQQLSANQTEANRAITALSNKKREEIKSASFQAQKNTAAAIQAQGTLLAMGGTGQSSMLQLMDVTRNLGFEQAQIDESLYDVARANALEQQGVLLDQSSANISAWNNLPADPLAPSPTFQPLKPMDQRGPSGLALAGNLISAGVGGATTGLSTYSALDYDPATKTYFKG